ncbi:MAG: hypothetical protein NVSMB52_09240 [Chloroflexota bacterium]
MIIFRLMSFGTLALGTALAPVTAAPRGPSSTWTIFAPLQKIPLLYSPMAMATDSTGRVFIADSVAGTVQTMSSSGEPLSAWDATANLQHPTGIAAHGKDAVYVADKGTGRLGRFSPAGKRVWSATVRNGRGTRLRVAATTSAGVYVLTKNFGVQRFSPQGKRMGAWRLAVRDKEFQSEKWSFCPNPPCNASVSGVDISADGAGNLYVLIEASYAGIKGGGISYAFLQVHSPKGTLLREQRIGRAEQGASWTGMPLVSALSVSHTGGIVIGGSNKTRGSSVALFSSGGRLLTVQGLQMCGRRRDEMPAALAIGAHGEVYASNPQDHAIQTLSAQLHPRVLWGCRGGLLKNPRGVAVDASGSVYVADTGNNRVARFAPDGHEVASWPTIRSPGAMGVGPSGETFLVHDAGNMVQVLSSAGAEIRRWTIATPGFATSGIAVARTGIVYVSDSHNGSIRRFESNGHFIGVWRTFARAGGKKVPLYSPEGLAVDGKGDVYIVDSTDAGDGRVLKVSPGGHVLALWPLGNSPTGGSSYPNAVTIARGGTVYVAGTTDVGRSDIAGDAWIARLSPNGSVVKRWSQFDDAEGIAAAEGAIYASDSRNNRVLRLSTSESR